MEPVAALASDRYEQVHEDMRTYFRDVYDHLARMAGHVEGFRELLTNVLTANLTQVSLGQNEDVRKISAWAAIIAVPTLITGVYGMNFERMPELVVDDRLPGRARADGPRLRRALQVLPQGGLAVAARAISEHVHWSPPAPPDRPSLCAVAGTRRTLMLDAGSSAAHTRGFLDELAAAGVAPPSLVVFTHSHWDHVLGADELGVPVVAHTRTAVYLDELARLDWSDEALDARLAAGEVSQFHVDNVKQELPAPREVRVAPADVVFADSLAFELGGGVRVRVQHVPNDHSDDGCVAFVEPDRVLFVGDATYDSPAGVLTMERALPLYDALLELRPGAGGRRAQRDGLRPGPVRGVGAQGSLGRVARGARGRRRGGDRRRARRRPR